ncbi:hypothetical protein M0804_007235 [Polistes exclamans]|nr:hypothetical protein M0804_007235 [Polistes exclamans]
MIFYSAGLLQRLSNRIEFKETTGLTTLPTNPPQEPKASEEALETLSNMNLALIFNVFIENRYHILETEKMFDTVNVLNSIDSIQYK